MAGTIDCIMSFSMWQKLSERMMANVVVSAPDAGAAWDTVVLTGTLPAVIVLSLTVSYTPDNGPMRQAGW